MYIGMYKWCSGQSFPAYYLLVCRKHTFGIARVDEESSKVAVFFLSPIRLLWVEYKTVEICEDM
jgi:hypothetical protein